ncbi:hypothetical protein ACUHMQ_18945 [Chitinimonas sp. PSY-7]|uniref:hypothetical protein n=1 Tax=Chitinimonas sp. PSY-7 TaxID=3459088 RepID=UPI00403FF135
MQKFVPIFQDIIASKSLECEELRDSSDGLMITLRNEDGLTLTVRFQEHLSYRLLDEGDALVAIDQLEQSGCKGQRLYKVDNSEFIEWFHKQSYGIRSDDQISHYSIFASNDVIDVIAFDLPVLTWEPN